VRKFRKAVLRVVVMKVLMIVTQGNALVAQKSQQ